MVAVALVTQLMTAVAAATPRRAAAVLGAENVITGSTTRAMRVILPVESSISLEFLEDNDDVTIGGRGRLTGVVLAGSDVDDPERPIFHAIRTSFCGKRSCEATALNVALVHGQSQLSSRGKLPAGTYDLYLIAEGAPARVELRLQGPRGKVWLRPSRDVDAGIYEPSGHVYADPVKNVYAEGRVFDVSGGSLWTFSAYRIKGSASNGYKTSRCIYRGDPPPEPVGFAPGCPGGVEFSALITRLDAPSGAYDHIHNGGAFMSAGGTWGYGVNHQTTGVVDDLETVAAYVDFESLDGR